MITMPGVEDTVTVDQVPGAVGSPGPTARRGPAQMEYTALLDRAAVDHEADPVHVIPSAVLPGPADVSARLDGARSVVERAAVRVAEVDVAQELLHVGVLTVQSWS